MRVLIYEHYKVAERLCALSSASGARSRESRRAGIAAREVSVAALVLSVSLGAALVGSAVMCAGILISIILVRLSMRQRRRRRRSEALERDLTVLLTSLASSVRAGIDPIRALTDARHYFTAGSPWFHELEEFRVGLSRGLDEVEAIERLCSSECNPDVRLLKSCLVLSRRHGSSLAEPLHRIAKVVRQRQSFRRKTRAALAMHRLSACGIGVCALLIGAMQVVMNRSGLEVVWHNRMGLGVVISGALCVVAGLVWMFQMGREEVL